jgi:AraC family transcriptional regulator, transcriptional activator of pobA
VAARARPRSPAAPLRRAAGRASIPHFALYAEPVGSLPGVLHVEDIRSRSRLHRWEIDAHVHDRLYQVVCVLSGAVECGLDEAHVALHGPVAVTIPAGVVHSFRFSPDTLGYVLTLSARWLGEDALGAIGEACERVFAAPRVLRLADHPQELRRIASLFAELDAEFRSPVTRAAPVPGWLARAIIWHLARHCDRDVDPAALAGRGALLLRFLQLIEEHHLEHWPLERYAQSLHVSVERLNRLCRAEASSSAYGLVQARLLREACRRVVYLVAPVAQLAFGLGFADPAYFCRFFKRHTGRTPGAYRREHAHPLAAAPRPGASARAARA